MQRYTDYDDFAQVYNRLWGGFPIRIMPILEQLALNDCPDGAAILDLCCGTGQLASQLTKRGYQVTGVDGSEQMLSHARVNAPEATFSALDARHFVLPTQFAVVFSTYDSLNHLLILKDLEKVFRNVHRQLEKRGIFVFDMNLEPGFRSRWVGTFQMSSETSEVGVASKYDEDEKLATAVITAFTQSEDVKPLWRRNDVTLTQRAYSVDELTKTLASAGFAEIQVFDARHDFAMPEDGRAFFRAMKQ